MPHSDQYAKELLRTKPLSLKTLLKQQKYWDLTFLRLYLDFCDSLLFEDPRSGLEAAKVAPKLAQRIPERRPYEWQHFTSTSEKQVHRELLARSYAVLGGANRANARFEEAAAAYNKAGEVCETGPVGLAVKANICKRLAGFKSALREFDEALDLVRFSIEIYREGDPVDLADALCTKGYVLGESGRHSEAVPCFARALKLVAGQRKSPRSERILKSGIHNLANAMSRSCQAEDVIQALRFVKEAKRLLSKKRDSISKHKLSWIEGRIVARLGSTRAAERLLLGVIEPMMKLGAVFEAALVALDLSAIYLRQGNWSALQVLAAETFERFVELSSEAEAIMALRLWNEGAQRSTLTSSSVQDTRETIESLMSQ